MKCEICTYQRLYPYGLLSVLVLLGVAMGMWQEIITPTLPNLKEKLNVSYETISRVISVRSLGNVMTLVVTGYVYDSFPGYVPYMMFGGCFLGGLSTIIIPWCNSFWLVAFLFYIQSGVQNALNNGGQLTILQTFKDKAIGKMQIYHMGYGIGGLLSGLICQPFLPKQIPHSIKITKYCKNKLEGQVLESIERSANNGTMSGPTDNGSFEYIYLIVGLMAIVISLIFLGFQILRNPDREKYEIKKKESWLMKINPKYTANGRVCLGVLMTILLFLYYCFYVFAIMNFLPYVVVYAIDPCKEYSMSQQTAAYLHSTVNGFFLLGRILSSFILDHNPTMTMLTFNFFNLIFALVLIVFSNRYAVALWIGLCGIRFCNSIVYPTGTSYINRYIIVTSSLISIAFLGGTAGEIMGPFTGGYVVDNYPSYYIFFIAFGSMVALFTTITIIIVLGKKLGLRTYLVKEVSSEVADIELNKS